MATIHHNTVKRATSHGVTLQIKDRSAAGQGPLFQAVSADGTILASGIDPRDALDLAIKELTPAKPARAAKPKKSTKKRKVASEDDGEEGDDEGGDRSIIKPKYKEKYQPHRMTCGDDLAAKVTEYATVEKKGELPIVSVDLLEKLGRANDVWNPSWRSLKNKHGTVNVGMIRMNLGNRLRGLTRNDKQIKWPS